MEIRTAHSGRLLNGVRGFSGPKGYALIGRLIAFELRSIMLFNLTFRTGKKYRWIRFKELTNCYLGRSQKNGLKERASWL